MGYYDNYIKRVNRYGNTLQERIQGKREHDFQTFMSKSPNRVRARNGEETKYYDAVLQTKEYDEDETIDYLLTPLDDKIPLGTVIHTKDTRFKGERNWINYVVDPYTTAGYDRYTIVELESELQWYDEGIKYTSLAHAVGGGSGARDKNINLKFKVQFSEAGVYLPNKRYSIIMPANEHIKKNMKVTLGGETWRVTGFDNISIKGVSFITLQEDWTDENDDTPVANIGQLDFYSVKVNRGNNFTIPFGIASDVILSFYYKKEERQMKYTVLPNENYTFIQEKNKITITPVIDNVKTDIKILLEGQEEKDALIINFFINQEVQDAPQSLEPSTLFVGEVHTYTVPELTKIAEISNDCAKIKDLSYEQKTVSIQGENVGKTSLILKNDNGLIEKEYNFEVQSMWLGGVD